MERLTELPGVGPQTAQNLKNAGYTNQRSLRGVSPEALANVNGIGTETAQQIVSAVTFDATGPFSVASIGGEDAKQFTDARLETDRGDTLSLELFGRNDPNAKPMAGGEMVVSMQSADDGRNEGTQIGSFGFTDDAIATTESVASGFGKARTEHENRPEQEQRTDEALKADLTTDYEEWAQNKDQLDYPGIDTP